MLEVIDLDKDLFNVTRAWKVTAGSRGIVQPLLLSNIHLSLLQLRVGVGA